jgi:tripartite-type tricarboxylate transporter receptor subunit TctC
LQRHSGALPVGVAGRTAFYMAPLDAAIGHLKEGKLIAFGVSTAKRAEIVPEIPTLAEAGLKGYDLALWFGMWARAGTPQAVVQKLNAQVNAIVQGSEVREQMGTFRRIAREANIPQQ